MSAFAAFCPGDKRDAANAALEALEHGPENFNIPSADGGAAMLHHWAEDTFYASLQSIAATYGLVIRKTTERPQKQLAELAKGMSITWPPTDPDWQSKLPMKGDVRTFGGKQYRSKVDYNSWSRDAAKELWEAVDMPEGNEWSSGVTYATGDVVTYEGAEYQCRQGHTSQPAWTPPAVLALWLPL